MSFTRKFISDLMISPTTGSNDDNNVCIVGTVVGVKTPVESSNRPVVYHVDDSTGCIKVTHFIHKRVNNGVSVGENDHPTVKKAVEEALEDVRSAYEVGACVEVRGKMQFFNGTHEILAFVCRALKDDDEELIWIQDTLNGINTSANTKNY